jgi:hypothetical protein
MTNYSKELETAKQAAEEAAELIRDFQKNRNFFLVPYRRDGTR